VLDSILLSAMEMVLIKQYDLSTMSNEDEDEQVINSPALLTMHHPLAMP
jgi:hypothetical protein